MSDAIDSPQKGKREPETNLLSEGTDSYSGDEKGGEPCAVGVLPNGMRFNVPETLDVLECAFSPIAWKLPYTWFAWATSMIATYSFYLWYIEVLPRWVLIAEFVFWRLAYDAFLGYCLHMQSNYGSFTKFYIKYVKPKPKLVHLIEGTVLFANKDIPPYRATDYPDEFNAWMLWRALVNIILGNDVMAYMWLGWSLLENFTFASLLEPLEIGRWIIGGVLIYFAIWSKTDAHRVIGDYAWFWGDFFFLLDKHLVFDGIFQMFPHPMYTVGYVFMYGATIISKSYTLFYVSLFAHSCQLLFLALVENPHIDKTYNAMTQPTEREQLRNEILYADDRRGYLNKRELIVFKNFNIFRASDIILVVLVMNAILLTFAIDTPWWMVVAHHLAWRLFFTFGLGWILRKQSDNRKWTHQYFSTPQEAFDNWKRIYNTSVTMVNFTFFLCAIRMFEWTSPIFETFESRCATLTVGIVLVLLNAYVSWGVYESIGDFGYFYGDFFVEDVPSDLSYTGIYRYLNNPDSSVGFAAYYGLVLICGNLSVVLPLAIASHILAKVFQIMAEEPHMKKKYGPALRPRGGLRTEVKKRTQRLKEEYEKAMNKLKREMEDKKEKYEKLLAAASKKKK